MNRLDARDTCQFLGGDLLVAVHHNYEGIFLVIFHDQGFRDRVLIHSEFARGHSSSSFLLVFVDVIGELDTGPAQLPNSGGDRCLFLAQKGSL